MEFLEKYSWIAVGLVMMVEYLIGASKLKSNSTIELVINVLKFVFRMEKKEIEEKK